MIVFFFFNSLPNDKFLDLNTIADDKLNTGRMTISLFDRVENTVGKGENAGYQHFLLFPWCFPKPALGSFKFGIVIDFRKMEMMLLALQGSYRSMM